jgi:hypothetical protein
MENDMKMTISFEVVEDNIINSTSESRHEVKDAVCAAIELYLHQNNKVVESTTVQILEKLMEDANA